MFPDSEVAKQFNCRGTKTTHILNKAMAPAEKKKVTELCTTNKFSILMDESNDKGNDKWVAILIRVLDRTVRRVVTKFLAIPVCNIGTGANMFKCLQDVFFFQDRGLDWQQCVGYSSDNASVMVGRHNSVLSRIREVQPNVYDLGCVCYLANTCVQYGLKKLPVPVEVLLIDVYFHFHHSSKRKEEYSKFLEFTDTEPAKIIKHCSTRWLSLEKCVRRFLQQWQALRSYFVSHDESEATGTRVSRCTKHLCDPLYALTYHFLEFIMGPLNEFNTTLQADESMVGYMHQEMLRLLRKFLGKFVKTKVITSSASVTDVNFQDPENQHDDDHLAVGMGTRTYLQENIEIPPETTKKFFRSVRAFYIEVAGKIVKKFPFEDTPLTTIGFLNPALRQKISAESVIALGQRFGVDVPSEALSEEYADYQLSPDSDLSPFTHGDRLDDFWFQMEEKKIFNGNQQFKHLPAVA